MSTSRLTDGVVVLDGHTLADTAAQRAGEDEEHARRFGWFPKRSTERTMKAAIERWQEQWRTGGATRAFALPDAATGKLLGGCEPRLGGDGVAAMSYWVFPFARRHGYASRAVRLACGYAFAQLDVERIELHVAADKARSYLHSVNSVGWFWVPDVSWAPVGESEARRRGRLRLA